MNLVEVLENPNELYHWVGGRGVCGTEGTSQAKKRDRLFNQDDLCTVSGAVWSV